jgi:predicted GNAT family N-acyltransferase
VGKALSFRVTRAVTAQDMAQVRAIRQQVFIDEQHIPAELEWDGHDDACVHVLAFVTAGTAVGTGRLAPDGRIGRMAVLASWRGRGAGRALLTALLEAAREAGRERVYLQAQESARHFYDRAGFRALGDPYLEAGIRHVSMEMRLDADDT